MTLRTAAFRPMTPNNADLMTWDDANRPDEIRLYQQGPAASDFTLVSTTPAASISAQGHFSAQIDDTLQYAGAVRVIALIMNSATMVGSYFDPFVQYDAATVQALLTQMENGSGQYFEYPVLVRTADAPGRTLTVNLRANSAPVPLRDVTYRLRRLYAPVDEPDWFDEPLLAVTDGSGSVVFPMPPVPVNGHGAVYMEYVSGDLGPYYPTSTNVLSTLELYPHREQPAQRTANRNFYKADGTRTARVEVRPDKPANNISFVVFREDESVATAYDHYGPSPYVFNVNRLGGGPYLVEAYVGYVGGGYSDGFFPVTSEDDGDYFVIDDRVQRFGCPAGSNDWGVFFVKDSALAVLSTHRSGQDKPRLRKVGFSVRQAEAIHGLITAEDVPTPRELHLAGFSPRQARTLLDPPLTMKHLLRGGFTRHQAKLILEGSE